MNNFELKKQLKEIRGCIHHLVNLNNTKIGIENGNFNNKEKRLDYLNNQISITKSHLDMLINEFNSENNVKSK